MQHRFTETSIQTRQGRFRLRVYADAHGKETVVLYTPELNPSKPVLVRVQSECLTGDTLGSLQCDCGEQLQKALARISESGNGALIYLRQEGRGIGLFEKIQSYQLQEKGFDTFEANVILGHRPDERTYEWVKIALADLGISKISLLTNNPSKISEIAKLGITVTERSPLVIETNQFNRRYFDAKRDKFKHFFHAEVSYYFYQFHAVHASEVEEIGEFLRDKNRDPLLKICVGVSADPSIFTDKNAIDRIQNIFSTCDLYEGFVPILHFSFKNSANTAADVERIKELMPFVGYLQTNDLSSDDLSAIIRACELFLADIPLSDDTFPIVHDERFRKTIAEYKAFILLDNSQGAGVKESKEVLQEKIDTLLNYGLNDIAILGGFGPDDLNTYFELRRHYRINFSIDAETKLNTGGELDLEKTKLYLNQLLRFDDPKEAGVEQTRSFLQQSKRDEWTVAQVMGRNFHVHPAVFDPGPFPSTEWYADEVVKRTKDATDFCEIGCGTGAISCLVALAHPDLRVVATDINPFATETTKLNAKEMGIADRIAVYTGDVFDGLPKDLNFDIIFWSLPFGFLDPGVPVDYREMQVFDPGYRSTRKFIHQAKTYLKPHGRLLLGFSSDLGHGELLEELASDERLHLTKVAEQVMKETDEVAFDLLEGEYLSTAS